MVTDDWFYRPCYKGCLGLLDLCTLIVLCWCYVCFDFGFAVCELFCYMQRFVWGLIGAAFSWFALLLLSCLDGHLGLSLIVAV